VLQRIGWSSRPIHVRCFLLCVIYASFLNHYIIVLISTITLLVSFSNKHNSKWFLDKTGHEGLNNLLAAYADKSAYALCTLAFVHSTDKATVRTFEGKTPGTIVPARGPKNFGWDPIFQPDGFDKTYAELDKDVKNTISHRFRAFDQLKNFLAKQ